MYTVKEKEKWIKDHLFPFCPVWFSYGRYDAGVYFPEDVWIENNRLYARLNVPVDITYLKLRAFAGKNDLTVIEFGKETPVEPMFPIETREVSQ